MTTSDNGPQSLTDLFLSFTFLSLQGFGGVMAIVQRELVDRKRWLSREEFVEEWAVAQILPGPNVVNLALMLGSRYFGWRGALTAVAGMLVMPLIFILLLAMLYGQFAHYPQVAGAVRGMGAVAAGLIFASGLRLAGALKSNPLGPTVCIALGTGCFVMVGLLRWPLIYALLALGGVGWALAYRKLRPS
jgi:chromate transporter